jgi:hypothetical protein
MRLGTVGCDALGLVAIDRVEQDLTVGDRGYQRTDSGEVEGAVEGEADGAVEGEADGAASRLGRAAVTVVTIAATPNGGPFRDPGGPGPSSPRVGRRR